MNRALGSEITLHCFESRIAVPVRQICLFHARRAGAAEKISLNVVKSDLKNLLQPSNTPG
jgi:hypothetical protein